MRTCIFRINVTVRKANICIKKKECKHFLTSMQLLGVVPVTEKKGTSVVDKAVEEVKVKRHYISIIIILIIEFVQCRA